MAYEVFSGPRYRDAAHLVHRYVDRELAAMGGGFYDADRSMPTAENGLVISALVAYHRATGDVPAMEAALSSAERMIAERMLPSGGFTNEGETIVSLEATVAMAEALTVLHRATADHRWLSMAQRSMTTIVQTFADPEGGFRGRDRSRSIELNVAVAKIGHELLDRAVSDGGVRDHAVRFLRSSDALSRSKDAAALLIANRRLRAAPWRMHRQLYSIVSNTRY
jgi:uncharacterized protein YyaL (SSP411 family)